MYETIYNDIIIICAFIKIKKIQKLKRFSRTSTPAHWHTSTPPGSPHIINIICKNADDEKKGCRKQKEN